MKPGGCAATFEIYVVTSLKNWANRVSCIVNGADGGCVYHAPPVLAITLHKVCQLEYSIGMFQQKDTSDCTGTPCH